LPLFVPIASSVWGKSRLFRFILGQSPLLTYANRCQSSPANQVSLFPIFVLSSSPLTWPRGKLSRFFFRSRPSFFPFFPAPFRETGSRFSSSFNDLRLPRLFATFAFVLDSLRPMSAFAFCMFFYGNTQKTIHGIPSLQGTDP